MQPPGPRGQGGVTPVELSTNGAFQGAVFLRAPIAQCPPLVDCGKKLKQISQEAKCRCR
jgi:hypothetical protein